MVVLCGGGGTRLWPRSRKQTPKQFIKLLDDKTLYQEAVERVEGLIPPERIFVITNKRYVDEIKKESPLIPEENIIAEPAKKDTAMAMGVAAAYIHQQDPDAVIVNLASDHRIGDVEEFRKTIQIAAEVAYEDEHIVTVGINPSYAHTGLGYIHAKEELKKVGKLPVLEVEGFTEKPKLTTAKAFLATGEYFWNANLYTWRTKTVLQAFKDYAPELYSLINNIQNSIGTENEEQVLKEEYQKAEKISIDYAISEKVDKMLMVPGDFGWSDVGDWSVVHELGEKTEGGNVVIQHGKGGYIGKDVSNCLIHSDDQLVAVIGLQDMVVVDSEDVLLICPKDKTQEVKPIVKKLKDEGKDEYL
jgi:mannose-1-phosphate guanylyltransferase